VCTHGCKTEPAGKPDMCCFTGPCPF
jgi:hypothetical protein